MTGQNLMAMLIIFAESEIAKYPPYKRPLFLTNTKRHARGRAFGGIKRLYESCQEATSDEAERLCREVIALWASDQWVRENRCTLTHCAYMAGEYITKILRKWVRERQEMLVQRDEEDASLLCAR